MMVIEFPAPDFRIRTNNNREFIFDPLRRRWLLLTPEEWVRQNFVQYLVRVMDYPSTLIAMEKLIWLGELKKRFDILVYDRNHQPWMMIECKEMGVKLSDAVIQQVLRYNIAVPVTYMIVTNGSNTYGWKKEEGALTELASVPEFV